MTQCKQVKINFQIFRGRESFYVFPRALLRCKTAWSRHIVTRKLSLLCFEGDGSSTLIISHLWWELGTLILSLPFLLLYVDRFRSESLEHQPRDKSTCRRSLLWADMCPASEHQKKDWLIICFLLNIKDSKRAKAFLVDPIMLILSKQYSPAIGHIPNSHTVQHWNPLHICRSQGGLRRAANTLTLPATGVTVGYSQAVHTRVFQPCILWGGQRWALLSPKQGLSFLVGGQKSGETQKNTGQLNFPSSRSITLPDTALPRTS